MLAVIVWRGIPSRRRARACRLRLLVAAMVLCGLAACVTLPAFTPRLESGPPVPLRVVGAPEVLSPERTEALLARLRAHGTVDLLDRHLAFAQAVTGAPLFARNEATLLVDGPATHTAMLRAIAAARDQINLEVFVFADDMLGQKFADVLLQK